LKLLKLRQIENGKEFYINPDEIASINPTFRMRAVDDVVVGEDNNIYYTLITLKNGVKVNAKESPYQIAYSQIATEILLPYGVKNGGPSGPKADYTAKHGHGTEPWAPDANLERSKKVDHTVGGAAPVK